MSQLPATPARVFIVVPVLNESPNISRLMTGLAESAHQLREQFELRVVLVDDGSDDDTVSMAEACKKDLNLTVLRHQTNRGPGASFATAFEFLCPIVTREDWVVTMEGDNTSRHELLKQMLTRASEGYDIVLASPYAYGGGILQTTTLRVFLSHGANVFLARGLGIYGIHTMSSFYRLYRGTAFRGLQREYGPKVITLAGFESMIELLLKMIYLKLTISEVPMVLDASLRVGKSKMKILKTIRGYITVWFRRSEWRPLSRVEGGVSLPTLEAEPA